MIVARINKDLEEDASVSLLDDILKDITNNNQNIYFIIILDYNNELQMKSKCENIALKKLDFKSAKQFYQDLLRYCGNIGDFCELNELFQMVRYDNKEIEEIVHNMCNGDNYEELKAKIKKKEEKEKKDKEIIEKFIEDEDLSKFNYLLFTMPSGLTFSIIKLIYPKIGERILRKDKKNNLIYQDNDNWYHIKENDFYKNQILSYIQDKDFRKECILNCLKVYSRLLYFYIKKNRKKICFPDNNIHYIFNSFNGKGIWKTFDEKDFQNKEKEIELDNDYNNLSNEDLEKHKDNILYFIGNNKCDTLKKNKILDIEFKKYLKYILIMLPSCFYFKKSCISIINKCIEICKELNLNYDRLSIFLISLKRIKEIKEEDFNLIFKEKKNEEDFNESIFNELKGEAYFLKGLKFKEIESFKNAIELYQNLNIQEIKIKIAYAYYEIGAIYFKEEKYVDCQNYLNEAQRLSIEYKDDFLKLRCNIDLALNLYKRYPDKLEFLENINSLLMKVINHNIKSNEQENTIRSLQKEAYELKISLNQYFNPDITILSSNPLKNYCSLLGKGIFSYNNNQYYLLQKLNEKMDLNIKIDFKLLNKNEKEDNLINELKGDNLVESFNKKGKILIIQSDDFSDNGEIILESKYGESELLTNDKLKFKLPVKKINYEIVILCFINSIKLKDIFKDKTNFLITFNEIDYKELDYYSLFLYNKLSIDFLINFIEKTKTEYIEDSFEESKNIFIDTFLSKIKKYEDLNKIKFKQFENHNNFIDLKKPDYIDNKKINYNIQKFFGKKKKNVFFYYPLFNFTPKARRLTSKYSEDILNIIRKINQNQEKYINIEVDEDEDDDNEKKNFNVIDNNNSKYIEKIYKNYKKAKKIGVEILKFFHRHQTFKHLFCIFREKDKKKFFNEIKDIKDMNESILILIIKNNDKIQFFNKEKEDQLKDFKNITYLIINGIQIKNESMKATEKLNDNKNDLKYKKIKKPPIVNNNKEELKEENNYFADFNSIFTDLIDDGEDSSESS